MGKGSFTYKAIQKVKEKNIEIYRLDITAALCGLIHAQLELESTFKKKIGRRSFQGELIVSGGLLGYKNEIIVDNINDPSEIYGIADGKGDFKNNLNKKDILKLEKIKKFIKNNKRNNRN